MKVMKIIMVILLIISTEACAAIKLKGKLPSPNDNASRNTNTNINVPSSNRQILPKRGDVAVIVEGSDRQHIAIAETMIINELLERGYKVVDEAKMKRIKMAAAKAKAAQYAWEGNIEGLLKLNGNYSVSATIIAKVQAEYPRLNDYDVYTGTASVAIMAVSGAKKLGGRTAESKTFGYSTEEAMRKSVSEAVSNGMQQFF